MTSAITRGRTLRETEIGGLRLTETAHPAGLRLPPHAHEPACVTYVLGGAFEERVGSDAQWATPGSVFLKPPGAVHSNRYGERGARSLLVPVPPSLAERLGRSARRRTGDLCRIPDGAWIAARMYREFRAPDAASGLAVEGLLLELLAGAARATGARERASAPPAWLRRARERLREEFRDPPRLATLARGAGVHPDHLGRTFREHFGTTPGAFVRRVRAGRAAEAIVVGDRPLSEIAFEMGFADQSHMTRELKRHLGITPGRLRAAG